MLTENTISMHGIKRPSLPGLIAQNAEEVVESTTKSAFALYKSDAANYTSPLKKLEELKGVGPATASLLLSILDSDNAPFFSDELFRWVCWDEALGGWKRKIKYDRKEYGMLWEGVKTLRERLGEGVSAVDLEKCAYVCGKLAVDKTLEAEVKKEAEKHQNEATETKSEEGALSSKQAKDEVGGITKSSPIPTTANTEQGKKSKPKPTKEKSAKRSSPEAGTEDPAPNAQASISSSGSPPIPAAAKTQHAQKPELKPAKKKAAKRSSPEAGTEDPASAAQASVPSASARPIPTIAKTEHVKKPEPNFTEKKSVKRFSPEPETETDDPLSDAQASSILSSPPKKAKTEHKMEAEDDPMTGPNKSSAKPTKTAAAASKATKPKTTKKASGEPKAKKPAKLPSGGENSRTLRPRKEISYET